MIRLRRKDAWRNMEYVWVTDETYATIEEAEQAAMNAVGVPAADTIEAWTVDADGNPVEWVNGWNVDDFEERF